MMVNQIKILIENNKIFLKTKTFFNYKSIEINSTDDDFWRKERVLKVFRRIYFGIEKGLIKHIDAYAIYNIKKVMDRKGTLIIDFGMVRSGMEKEMELFSRLWKSMNNECFCTFIFTHVDGGGFLKKIALDYCLDHFEVINKEINEWILDSW